MTARLRSGATTRKTGTTSRPAVHLISSNDPFEERRHESGVTSKVIAEASNVTSAKASTMWINVKILTHYTKRAMENC